MIKNMKMKPKLISAFLVLSLIPMAITGIIAYKIASGALDQKVYANLHAIAAAKHTRIQDFFSDRGRDASVFAMIPFVRTAVSNLDAMSKEAKEHGYRGRRLLEYPPYKEEFEKYHSFLTFYQEKYGCYDVFLFSPNSGRVLMSAAMEDDFGAELKTENTHLAEAWQEMKQTKKVITTDVKPYAPSKGAPAMFVVAPAFDQSGNYVGGVGLQIGQDAIDTIMQQADGMGKTGETYLVGQDMLFRSNSRLASEDTLLAVKVDTKGPQEVFKTKKEYEGVYGDYTSAADAKSQARNYSTKLGGVPVLGVVYYLDALDWVLVAEIDQEEAFHAVYSLRTNVIVLIIIAALLVGLLAYILATGVANPIIEISKKLELIARGDFTVKATIDSKDEIGDLSRNINKMTGDLSTAMAQVADAVQQLNSATEEVATSASQISDGAQQQAASFEQLSSSIQANASNAGGANDIVQKTARDAHSTGEGMENTIDAMNVIEKSSKQIADAVAIITDIADQTNLLALNAAIEAARAGEHGKGFAVVADEVRKLAERSAASAKDITELIKESTLQVDHGADLSRSAGESLKAIVCDVTKVAEQIQSISSATQEQAATMEENASITESNASSAEELASLAEEMTGQSEQLQKLVTQFKITH